MLRRYISCMLACLCVYCVQGQLSIDGTIIDKSDRQPLPAVQVQLSATSQIAITDENGHYHIEGIKPGSYRLVASLTGYIKDSIALNIDKPIVVPSIQLKRNVLDLAAITVRADRSRMASLMPAMDLKLQPVRSAQDLLRTVPGLFIAQHAGGGKAEQIYLRGTDNDHGIDFGVFMDGIPVNLPNHAHGQGYADMHFIIPELIGNAAYFKGPYEAELGNFTNTGAAVYKSLYRPDRSFLKLEAGQFATKRIAGLVAIPLQQHATNKPTAGNFYVAGEYAYTNSYFNNPQHFNRGNLFARYNTQLGNNSSLSFIASTFHSSWNASGQVPDRAVVKGGIDRLGSIDSTEGGITTRTNLTMIMQTKLNEHAQLYNQLYYSRNDFKLYSNFTFFMDDPDYGDEIKQWEKRHLLGYNGSLKHTFNTGSVQWVTEPGINVRADLIHLGREHVQYRNYLSAEDSAYARVMNYSFYLNQTWKWEKRWTINIGLRNDLFAFDNNNFLHEEQTGKATAYRFSPKLNVFYDASNKVCLFFKAGTGFHSNYAAVAVSNGNNKAVPRSVGSDIGANINIAGRLYITTALWWLQSGTEYRFVADDGSFEDIGASVRTGIDASIRYHIAGKWWTDANLNFARPRLQHAPDSANRIPMAPLFTATGGISYQASSKWSGALRYRYMGKRPATEDNTVKAADYLLCDAVLQYAFPHCELGLSAENLFNVKWREAQYYDESRLKGEAEPVMDFHYTPGTPLFIKAIITFRL